MEGQCEDRKVWQCEIGACVVPPRRALLRHMCQRPGTGPRTLKGCGVQGGGAVGILKVRPGSSLEQCFGNLPVIHARRCGV